MPNGLGFTYMIITQVLFFIFTIGLIVWLLRYSKQEESGTTKEILDRRLVSGEINKKEYGSLLKTITSTKID